MKSDKSVILLKQYAYKKYNYININDLNSIVKCKEFIGIKRTEITKHDLFFKMYRKGVKFESKEDGDKLIVNFNK